MWRLERDDLFWELRLDGPRVCTRFGGVARGAAVREVVRELADARQAAAAAERAVAAKQGAGFRVVDAATEGGRRLPPSPLEAALWDHPDDLQAWAVYVDWLQTLPGRWPRVEAASAAFRALKDRGLEPEAVRLRDRLMREDLGEDLSHHAMGSDRVTYRFGFWQRLHLPRLPDLDTDAARFLEHVRLASPDEEGFDDPGYAQALEALHAHPPPGLRSVVLDDTEYQLSWLDLGRFALFEPCPRLETVDLVGGALELGRVRAQNLRRFAFRTTGLPRQVVRALLAGDLPALADLELWVGDPDRADADLGDIASLLRKPLPSLRRLALRNAPFTNALIDVIAGSPLLPRLHTLDLSLGTLTAPGARRLVDLAPSFAHLEAIHLEQNLLDEDAAAAVARALPNAALRDQREGPDDGDPDDGDDVSRYVAVME